MPHEWEKQPGILLQATPYLGSHRILKVFTPDSGLLTFIAKHVKANAMAHTLPFCCAEWVYRKSRSDIYPLKEAKLLDPFLRLRETYDTLMAAGSIANDLLRSQFPHRSALPLYELLHATLNHLPRHPIAISQSFRLKLLQFEGMLSLQPTCAECGKEAYYISRGESRCAMHAKPGSFPFNKEEWKTLLMLGSARRFSELESIYIPSSLNEKTTALFLERIQH